ncbi:protein unc-50 homolog [Neocloeon triangulifer]|uniref:protein unc-50 homolog n=1 Tax=Neocloeon triangulifer TaxID=2078957 RepID=UPI00286F6BA3|nr:protein unc-50 homolog [Neocloeon triangulifer]
MHYSRSDSLDSLPLPLFCRMYCSDAAAKRYKYLRRILRFEQMDFEFAFWQMVYLFVSPQKVYRNFHYRKQTKAQFARDDPAFLVLLAMWLFVSSIGFALVLKLSFYGFLKFFLYVVLVDCIGIGILVATALWFVTNRLMVKPACRDQDVEWGYAFDVHLNAFFPVLFILHVVLVLLYHVFIAQPWFISLLFGNTLYLMAVGYYIYITFLGYSCLPILQNTQVLLYPLTGLIFFYVCSLALTTNISTIVMDFYYYRVA